MLHTLQLLAEKGIKPDDIVQLVSYKDKLAESVEGKLWNEYS